MIAVIIGFIIEAVAGIGGILLIVPLTLIAGLDIHQASATLLLTFLFTGIYSVFLFQRRGTIDWRLGIPVCVGALAFSFVGAIVNARADFATLNFVIALIITFAGAYVVFPGLVRTSRKRVEGSKGNMVALLAIGAVSGFGSGISGAGGPLFSVPIMLMSGFALVEGHRHRNGVAGSLGGFRLRRQFPVRIHRFLLCGVDNGLRTCWCQVRR